MTLAADGLQNAKAYRWTYADATARTSDTGFTSDDVGAFALQLDTGSLYRLTATTPTWALAAGTGDLLSTNNLSEVANAATARTNLGVAIGADVQAYDADLGAVAGLAANGIIARTGAGTAAARALTAGSSKLSVTNGDGVSGNPTVDVGTLTSGDIPSNAADTTGKSAKTDALNSATTVVNVAAATAPTTGQVLTATDSTHATWQDAAAGAAALDDLTDVTITTPADADVLTYDSGTSAWVNLPAASGFSNPMTTADDVIVGGASGAATRLAKGSSNTVLGVDGSGVLGYKADPSGGGGGQELAYVSVATSTLSTTSTTLVDLTGASITATVGSRPVRVQFYSPGSDTSMTDDPRVEFSLYDVTAGAEVGGCYINGGSGGTTVTNLTARVNPASGSRTWKIRWRAVGSIGGGSARVLGTATRPVYLLVEEL